MVALDVRHDEPCFGIATRRNVALALWRDAPRLEWFRALRTVTKEFCPKWPDGTGFINLIVDGTPRFPDAVRKRAARASKREDLYRLGNAFIIGVPGLKGSATRAFLSTVFLMAPGRIPKKVFREIGPAASWLAPRLGLGWTAEGLAEFCRACEHQLGKSRSDSSES